MVKLTEEEKKILISKERERRRILRLKQVREQSSMHAKVIREVVSQRKREIVEDLRAELHVEVQAKIEELTKNGVIIATQPNSSSQLSNKTPRRSKSKTPRRKRKLTHDDLEKAEKRSQMAIKKLRDAKNQFKKEKESKLQLRIEAEKQANRILRSGTGAV